MELSPAVYAAIIAAVGILLYAFLWRVTRDLPRAAKVTARAGLTIVALLPVAVGLLAGLQMPAQMAQRDRGEIPQKRAAREAPRPGPAEMARESRPPAPAERAPAPQPTPSPGRAEAPPPAAGAAPPTRTPLSPRLDGIVPPPAGGAAPPIPEPAPSKADGVAPMGAPAAPTTTAQPAAAQGDWDVVPVFYGTDRSKVPGSQQVDYGSDRGRRLQLGQALVTVPKSHQVPAIERPWVYHLPFTQIVLYREAEDPNKHFTMKEIRELSREQFLALVRKRLESSSRYKDHALVFVHGFNTSFEFSVFRTAQISYDLKFDGAPFLYSWPSKGQFGVQDYSYDRESAGAAEPYLKEFLEIVARETGAKSVSIIAHSMGNQALLPVLRELRRSTPAGVEVSQVILAAPDVDRDNFEFLAREIQGVSRGVTLFAAANDRALMASRQFWGGVPRAGDVPPEGPIVVPGVDTIDVTAINTELWSLNHSGYAEKTALLNDIELLIQTGERPPEKRIPILERITTSRGSFWRYPGTR